MTMKLLVDTNVLADYYLQRETFSKDANRLIVAAINKDVELWAAAKSYTDIFYVGRKYFSSKVLQNAFFKSFQFINVCSIDKEDLVNATQNCWSDLEDCLIWRAALKVNADAIITRDTEGFSAANTETKTPTEILEVLANSGLQYEIVEF